MSTESPGHITRRTFVVASGLAVASLYLVGCGGSSSSTAPPTQVQVLNFITVSRILTGVKDLPSEPAADYLSGLEAAGLELSPNAFVAAAFGNEGAPMSMSDMKRMGATALPGADACMRAIAGAWWSGIVPTAEGGQRVVTFQDALVWRTVHESSNCLGATGSWSKPGEQVA